MWTKPCCVLCTYRSSSCRSASRWTGKLETSAEVWCPLRGAKVKSQWTLKFPSQRGTKHSVTLIRQEISVDWNMFRIPHNVLNVPVILNNHSARCLLPGCKYSLSFYYFYDVTDYLKHPKAQLINKTPNKCSFIEFIRIPIKIGFNGHVQGIWLRCFISFNIRTH